MAHRGRVKFFCKFWLAARLSWTGDFVLLMLRIARRESLETPPVVTHEQ